MKTAFFLILATASLRADAPTDKEVLQFIIDQNRMHVDKDVEVYLKHIPKDGFLAVYPKGSNHEPITITPGMIRENTLESWKRFDPSDWSSGMAIRGIERHEDFVEITVAFTEVVPHEGNEILGHGVLRQRLESSDGVAQLVRQELLANESRFLNQQAEQGGAGEPATRAESDSEGGDKPKPESEGRSR